MKEELINQIIKTLMNNFSKSYFQYESIHFSNPNSEEPMLIELLNQDDVIVTFDPEFAETYISGLNDEEINFFNQQIDNIMKGGE